MLARYTIEFCYTRKEKSIDSALIKLICNLWNMINQKYEASREAFWIRDDGYIFFYFVLRIITSYYHA